MACALVIPADFNLRRLSRSARPVWLCEPQASGSSHERGRVDDPSAWSSVGRSRDGTRANPVVPGQRRLRRPPWFFGLLIRAGRRRWRCVAFPLPPPATLAVPLPIDASRQQGGTALRQVPPCYVAMGRGTVAESGGGGGSTLSITHECSHPPDRALNAASNDNPGESLLVRAHHRPERPLKCKSDGPVWAARSG